NRLSNLGSKRRPARTMKPPPARRSRRAAPPSLFHRLCAGGTLPDMREKATVRAKLRKLWKLARPTTRARGCTPARKILLWAGLPIRPASGRIANPAHNHCCRGCRRRGAASPSRHFADPGDLVRRERRAVAAQDVVEPDLRLGRPLGRIPGVNRL